MLYIWKILFEVLNSIVAPTILLNIAKEQHCLLEEFYIVINNYYIFLAVLMNFLAQP